MFHTHPATACLHSIIFSFLHQHRYTLINDVLGYCYCYCYYCVLIASYLRRVYSVYFILYPLRCSGKKLMMKYETLPKIFFLRYFAIHLLFSHLDSIMSAIVCFLLKSCFTVRKEAEYWEWKSFLLLYFAKPEGWMWWELSREIHHTNKSNSSGKSNSSKFWIISYIFMFIFIFSNLFFIIVETMFLIFQKKTLSTERAISIVGGEFRLSILGIETHFLVDLLLFMIKKF